MADNPLPHSAEESLAPEQAWSSLSLTPKQWPSEPQGDSRAYQVLVSNLLHLLNTALRPRRCTAFSSEQRVHVPFTGFYSYPDISVVCGRRRYDRHSDSLENPHLLVEICSPDSEAYIRAQKVAQYRQCESLQEYLLVSQTEPRIERYSRHQGGNWRLTEVQGFDATLRLDSLACSLALADVYNMVWDEIPVRKKPRAGRTLELHELEEETLMSPEKVIVYGRPRCPGVPPVRGLLTQAKVPFEYIDIHEDRQAARYVTDLNNGNESVPTLRFPDGSTLTEPSFEELRAKLASLGYRVGVRAWLIGNAWRIFILVGVLLALARIFELF